MFGVWVWCPGLVSGFGVWVWCDYCLISRPQCSLAHYIHRIRDPTYSPNKFVIGTAQSVRGKDPSERGHSLKSFVGCP